MGRATKVEIFCLLCVRQEELMSTDIANIDLHGFIKISYNLYYCMKCAKATGFVDKDGRAITFNVPKESI